MWRADVYTAVAPGAAGTRAATGSRLSPRGEQHKGRPTAWPRRVSSLYVLTGVKCTRRNVASRPFASAHCRGVRAVRGGASTTATHHRTFSPPTRGLCPSKRQLPPQHLPPTLLSAPAGPGVSHTRGRNTSPPSVTGPFRSA